MTLDKSSFLDKLLSKFKKTPAIEQYTVLEKLSEFVEFYSKEKIFILSGYAGTGKTSIISALVKTLQDLEKPYIMLAPTGRAAKVMSNYSGFPSSTIHKVIYFSKDKSGGVIDFSLRPNKMRDTIFIVDEASMLADKPSESLAFSNSSLLDDLLEFVYSSRGCKLIFVGDKAQLPPIGYESSPALEEQTFSEKHELETCSFELTKVFRQKKKSAILENATKIREFINSDNEVKWGDLRFIEGDDFLRLQDGQDIQNAIFDSYSNASEEETIVITRSNKRANLFNSQIRARIKLMEGELSGGDILMAVKNNYFWLEDKERFIANGDLIEVLRVIRFYDMYDKKFAQAEVRLLDYDDLPPFQAMLMLNTLYTEAPALPFLESQAFFERVMQDYTSCYAKSTAFKKLKENPYFNSIQVKFGYAVTCHKSQGGQWKRVFLEQAYNPNKVITKDYLRWLYTAITRASEKVYLLGFEDEFFIK